MFNKPVIDAEVRSSRHLYGSQYRIGVCFIEVARADEEENSGSSKATMR